MNNVNTTSAFQLLEMAILISMFVASGIFMIAFQSDPITKPKKYIQDLNNSTTLAISTFVLYFIALLLDPNSGAHLYFKLIGLVSSIVFMISHLKDNHWEALDSISFNAEKVEKRIARNSITEGDQGLHFKLLNGIFNLLDRFTRSKNRAS